MKTCRRDSYAKPSSIEQKFIDDPTIQGCEKGVNTVVRVALVRRKENGRHLWERNKFAMPLSSPATLLCLWNLANDAGSPLPIKSLSLSLSLSLCFYSLSPFCFLSDRKCNLGWLISLLRGLWSNVVDRVTEIETVDSFTLWWLIAFQREWKTRLDWELCMIII